MPPEANLGGQQNAERELAVGCLLHDLIEGVADQLRCGRAQDTSNVGQQVGSEDGGLGREQAQKRNQKNQQRNMAKI